MKKHRTIRRAIPRDFLQKLKLFLGIVLGAGAIYYFSFNDYGIVRHFRIKKELHQIQKKIDMLQEQQEQIKNTIYKLQFDYDYIERLARENLKLVKKGEELYIVKKSRTGIKLEKQ